MKDESFFTKKTRSGGVRKFRSQCKTCNATYKKPSTEAKYYLKNKEKIKAKSIERYKNFKEEIREKQRIYFVNNKDVYRKAERKRRALKLGLEENFTSSDERFIYMLFSNLCFKCQTSKNLSIDHHYALSLGHKLELDNAVVLCKSCNSSKYTKTPEEFYTESELDKLTHLHRFTY
tara:strand:+ start:1383 stop:1910 length:528 start_codon:yes stop_codon:yes gene_type:complete